MNLFELFVKIGVDDQASGNISKIAHGLGNGLKTAANVGVAAVGAASTAIIALGKIGLEYNSQMEQYTTNFTTMLGSQESALQKVQELKEFAASTPLSMDDLAKGTQTLLAFGVESEKSTGILRQLGDIALGDADKMQRLATAFGKATAAGKVTGDTVQQMIDAGWNPLIQISQAAGETMEETQKRMSAGAVSVEELQAAMEAVTSGTGQFAGGMEAASHTTQGLISTLKDNAKALVGEVFMPISDGLLGRVLPGAIEAISSLTTAFRENGISGMIEAAGGIVGSAIGEFTSALPNFVNTAVEIVKSINKGISDNLPTIAKSAIEMITVLAKGILGMLPEIIKLGLDLIVSLANGIAESLPELIPTIVDVVAQIVETLIANVDKLIMASLAIIVALAKGLIMSIPQLIKAIPQIIMAIVNGFNSFMSQITDIGKNIVNAVGDGIKSLASEALQWGKDLIQNFIDGIKAKWDALKQTITNTAQTIRDRIAFSEPKEGPLSDFHTYAPDMMDLFIKGIKDNEKKLTDQIEKTFDFGERTISTGISYGSYGDGGFSAGGGYGASQVSVVQNIYSEAKTAADLMQEALYHQERAVLLGV